MKGFDEIELEQIGILKKQPMFKKYVVKIIENLKKDNESIILYGEGDEKETIEMVKIRRENVYVLDGILDELNSPVTLLNEELSVEE